VLNKREGSRVGTLAVVIDDRRWRTAATANLRLYAAFGVVAVWGLPSGLRRGMEATPLLEQHRAHKNGAPPAKGSSSCAIV